MNIVDIRLEEIKPYPNNPRNNEAAIEQVKKSIGQFGFRQPIVVDKNNIIIVGHTRYYAASELKMITVPVLVASDLNDKQCKAYRIADNKTNEFAEWDIDLLGGEFLDLSGCFTGFTDDEIKALTGDIESVEFPDLNSDGRGEFEQITFTLHNSQAETVRDAIDKCLLNITHDANNSNKNGNALYNICAGYLQS